MNSLFDDLLSDIKKTSGMATAAYARSEVLALAQHIAVGCALKKSSMTTNIDDVIACLIERGIKPEELGNAAGSIFRGKRWRFTGEWIKSERVSNHSRMIRVWELVR